MTTVDTAALRATAEAATPGPWEVYEQHGRDYTDEGWSEIGVKAAGHDVAHTYPLGFDNDYPERDAAHIAAFDPPTVLALLDELDTLRATVARIEDLADEFEDCGNVLSGNAFGKGWNSAHADVALTVRAALVSPTPDPTTP